MWNVQVYKDASTQLILMVRFVNMPCVSHAFSNFLVYLLVTSTTWSRAKPMQYVSFLPHPVLEARRISDNTSAASIKGTAALHDFAGKKDAATNQTALFPRWSLPLLSWMRSDAEACRGFFLGEKQTSRAGNLLPGVKVQIAA